MQISHVIRGEEWLPSTPKHLLLYRMLQIEPPQFAHLPLLLNQKGQKLSKRFGVEVSVAGYRERGFLPEAVINGIALLGWNPPHREDPSILSETTGVFMRHEVMSLENMIDKFNLDKVTKSGAKFQVEKLEFLNSMHIRNKFDYIEGNASEALQCVKDWRKFIVKEFPSSLHREIKRTPDHLMLKIMDMMKIRMRYMGDIKNHAYFFTDPDYDTELGRKFIVKLKQAPETNIRILADLAEIMGKISNDSFDSLQLNKACSMYLYEQNQKPDFSYKNEDIFFLFRFAMTGNPVGAPIGEISEVIGKKAVLERLKEAQQVFQDFADSK